MVTPDPIFKGCTRPQMLVGVPMMPMMVLVMLVSFAALGSIFLNPLAPIPVLALGAIPYWKMRKISEKDDQRLNQLFSRYWHLRAHYGLLLVFVSKQRLDYYGGLISYSPFNCRATTFLRSKRADI